MMGQSQDPDYLVTILTFISLRDNQQEKEIIEKIVSK
jgi:hypothetical protein